MASKVIEEYLKRASPADKTDLDRLSQKLQENDVRVKPEHQTTAVPDPAKAYGLDKKLPEGFSHDASKMQDPYEQHKAAVAKQPNSMAQALGRETKQEQPQPQKNQEMER